MSESLDIIQDFINDCITNYSLLKTQNNYFYSDRLLHEIEKISEKSKKARKNALSRNSIASTISNPPPPPSHLGSKHSGDIQRNNKTNHNNRFDVLEDIESSALTEPTHSECVANAKQTLSERIADAGQALSESIAKERKKEGNKEKKNYGEFSNVALSDKEFEKSLEKYGEHFVLASIEYLSSYKESSGKSYKSDYAALNQWVFDAVAKRSTKNQLSESNNVEFKPRQNTSVWDEVSSEEQ